MTVFSRIAISIALTGIFQAAQAEPHTDLTPRFTNSEFSDRSNFMVGTEFAQVQSPKGSATGFGGMVGFGYFFSNRWSVQGDAAQTLDTSMAYLYTSFRTEIFYTLSGYPIESGKELRFDGKRVIRPVSQSCHAWFLGAGLEQLLFNGSTTVYPATGANLSCGYQFNAFGHLYAGILKYATYTVNTQPATSVTLNLVLNLMH